jgi:archaemetzincin
MRILSIVPIGEVGRKHLEELAAGLTVRLPAACLIHPPIVDAGFAFSSLRGQHHSTEILKRLLADASADSWRILGVTSYDLFIPILTFVFGEAQLNGRCAVVSAHRLHQEFYGMPHDEPLFRERLLKECMHELGHTLGLHHCADYRCVMCSSNNVERIDLKGTDFCAACAALPVFL